MLVERLGQEVPRAARERAALDLVGRVTGQDQHGQGDRGRDLLVELLHDREAVRLGHVQVEQQQVELRRRAEVGHLGGPGGRRDLPVPPPPKQAVQQLRVLRPVVDDEDPEVLHRRDRRAAYVRHPVSFSPSVRNRDEMVTCGALGCKFQLFRCHSTYGSGDNVRRDRPPSANHEPESDLAYLLAKLRAVPTNADPTVSPQDLEELDADGVLEYLVERFHPRLTVACSFQKEASVILDLLLRIAPDARVFTLDTARPVPGDLRHLEAGRGPLRDRGPGLPGAEHRAAGRAARRQAVGARSRRLLRDPQGRPPQPRARGHGRVDLRPAARPVAVAREHAQAGVGRQARAVEGEPARRLERGRRVAPHRRARRAVQPAARPGLLLDRLHALHEAGHRARRPLGRRRQDRVRHPRR